MSEKNPCCDVVKLITNECLKDIKTLNLIEAALASPKLVTLYYINFGGSPFLLICAKEWFSVYKNLESLELETLYYINFDSSSIYKLLHRKSKKLLAVTKQC